jgi:dihydrolipoamide dehydrogenase
VQNPREVDVLILGAGTAGMAAYRAAVAVTPRVALVEAGSFGTTCAKVGCMPSKLLLAAAEAAHAVERAHLFGAGEPGRAHVDGRRVMARVRGERDRFVGFVTRAVDDFPAEHKILGRARFLDAHTVAVGDERIGAKAVVIATGSRPRVPAMLEGLGDRLVVNDDIFSWEELPRSLVVFGLGIIGLELGQALARLGVRVRLFGARGHVGPLTDPAVRDAALGAFREELCLDPDPRVLEVRREGDGVEVRFVEGGREIKERFDLALAATGRAPNVDRLDLERTGLALDARGLPRFDRATMQCGASSIFLAGDVNDDRPLLHEAADEGKVAGDNAARFPEVRPGPRRTPIAVVFTDPQMALIGETWAEVKERAPVVGAASFEDQGRSRVMLQNRGLLHVYAERGSGRLLGAEMAGPRAEHLGHLLAWAHQQRLTVEQMLGMPFYHPVIEEGLRTALRDAAAQLSR